MTLGANSSTVKAHNEFLIIDLIRRHQLSRRELAELSGLTPATVSSIIARLMAEGVVAEGSKVPSRGGTKGGRRRTHLQLVPGSRVAGGILVDRTGIEGTVVDILGTIYARLSHRLPYALDQLSDTDLVELLTDMIRHLCRELPSDMVISGWGVGVPWWYPPAVDWSAVAERVREKSQVAALYLVQNAVSAATGEWWYADKPLELPSLHLFLGGGIGGCFIRHGERNAAPIFQPVEIGHMGVQSDGPLCYCGGRGCLEQLAGPTAELARANPHQAAEYLAYALRSLTLLFDLQEIIVSGPKSQLLERDYLPVVRQALGEEAPRIRMTRVVPQGEAVGAAAVVFHSDGIRLIESQANQIDMATRSGRRVEKS